MRYNQELDIDERYPMMQAAVLFAVNMSVRVADCEPELLLAYAV